MKVADLRREYMQQALTEAEVQEDPLEQFRLWFEQALETADADANAMTLATATPEGRPSARIVLLKDFDADGFVFFTNFRSRKGGELAQNPWAALVFWWSALERQVRIEGTVTSVDPEVADAYFESRPLGSRLGAWASPQSEVLPSRQELERRMAEAEARFPNGEVPRPTHWGGYRLEPVAIEFWQGRASRLHDRIRYRREAGGPWHIERLAP